MDEKKVELRTMQWKSSDDHMKLHEASRGVNKYNEWLHMDSVAQ